MYTVQKRTRKRTPCSVLSELTCERTAVGDGGGRSLAEMLESMAAAQSHVPDLASGDGKLGARGDMGAGGGLGTGRVCGIMALTELQSQLRGFAPDDTQAARSSAASQDQHRLLPSLVSPPPLCRMCFYRIFSL